MKYLSLTALIYAAIFILNFLYGNFILITIQGFVGAGLFVALAVYLNTLDDENLKSHTKFSEEIGRLSKEIDELKRKQAT